MSPVGAGKGRRAGGKLSSRAKSWKANNANLEGISRLTNYIFALNQSFTIMPPLTEVSYKKLLVLKMEDGLTFICLVLI